GSPDSQLQVLGRIALCFRSRFAESPPASLRRSTSARRAVHPRLLPWATLPLGPFRSRQSRGSPIRRYRFFPKHAGCKRLESAVLQEARCREMRTGAHSGFRLRAATAPANRVRYSKSCRSRSCAELPRGHRCPSLRSGNRRSFVSPEDDREFHDLRRYVRDMQVDREKLRPTNFQIPFVEVEPPVLNRRENEARRVNGSHSNANES